MLATGSAAQAAPITLIDNNAWTYFLPSNEQSGASQGSHEIVADYGGSLKISLSGNPGVLYGVQATLAPIHAGDVVTLSLAHSDIDGISHIIFSFVDYTDPDQSIFYATPEGGSGEPINQAYDATWIADADYSAGTNVYFRTAVWPGSATYWLIDATVTPEPATLSLLAVGIGTLILRRRRK